MIASEASRGRKCSQNAENVFHGRLDRQNNRDLSLCSLTLSTKGIPFLILQLCPLPILILVFRSQILIGVCSVFHVLERDISRKICCLKSICRMECFSATNYQTRYVLNNHGFQIPEEFEFCMGICEVYL